MITATLSFAMHILTTTFKLSGPVINLIQYVLPYTRNMATKAVKPKSIKFNTKHLTKGDPLPPFNGTLRVYNMRYCPYAQRTILALNAKEIDYEVVNINLVDKPEWLTSKSALAKVPALEIENDVTIYESLVTVEYLDDVYPQRPLLSKDPLRKAYDKIIVETFSPVHTIFYKSILKQEITDDLLNSYKRTLDYIQSQLEQRGTKFLGGELPGYADYMIWPWFERILGTEDDCSQIVIDPIRYKVLRTYLDAMREDPAVSCYAVSPDVMKKVIEGYGPGKSPNYDLLLEE